ncbi:MAG: hypothetical protein PHF18_08760 [Methanosarcina sp.]|nr:hypothetical protein [Methanosarcina sp.]MDD3246923.1 hypothetical protein [Methanosarcina sp.]MDD4249637.1 hypothetical protein [Methanosarcina sp.]
MLKMDWVQASACAFPHAMENRQEAKNATTNQKCFNISGRPLWKIPS